MRLVHEILSDSQNPYTCIAFVQHGNESEGFQYEVICPFCGETQGFLPRDPEVEWKDHLNLMRVAIGTHRIACTAGGFSLRVQKTTVPLNTEKPFQPS